MPLQNRVTPFGEIIAVPDRGMFMGNRGRLHNERRQIARQVTPYRAWVVCQTRFKDRKRQLMAPKHYTELFFLDEATALAAGHRPCFECRRKDYQRFKSAWLAGNPDSNLDSRSGIEPIDRQLHAERLTEAKTKRTYRAAVHALPDGTMVQGDGEAAASLLWRGQLRRWTPGGYVAACAVDPEQWAEVLTPLSIVRAIGAGYVPVVHPTVERMPPG